MTVKENDFVYDWDKGYIRITKNNEVVFSAFDIGKNKLLTFEEVKKFYEAVKNLSDK